VISSVMILPANSKIIDAHEIKQENFNSEVSKRFKSSGNWLLDMITKLFSPSSRSGGSRGDLCAIAPSFDGENNYIWTRQPLFIWSGRASLIRVVDIQSQKTVWQKSVDSDLEFGQMRIDRPLIAGRKYEWYVISDPDRQIFIPSIDFEIVSEKQDKKIRVILRSIEKQLIGKTSEEVILAKAKYFAEQKMWGDVQEFLSMIPQSSTHYKKTSNVLREIQESLKNCY
jgi:Na+-transporting NADH:ubiquinone oxidoreductase subunit NqrF